jgi:hypothetical protein
MEENFSFVMKNKSKDHRIHQKPEGKHYTGWGLFQMPGMGAPQWPQ